MPSSPASRDPDDLARAGSYTLIARLLLRPDPVALRWLAAQPDLGDGGPLQASWSRLVRAAREQGSDAPRAWSTLFVALGKPSVDPYASQYVDGTLMTATLADLRHDLRALGLARAEGSRELEDHLGAVCEAMGQLVAGGAAPAEQARFFDRHLGPWAQRCLDDIAAHPGAGFYAALAHFAGVFLASEQEACAQDLATA